MFSVAADCVAVVEEGDSRVRAAAVAARLVWRFVISNTEDDGVHYAFVNDKP